MNFGDTPFGLAERLYHNRSQHHGPIAQSAEHLAVNQGVVGSSPTGAAT